MKNYTNDFTYGRDLLKKILFAAVGTSVVTLIVRDNPTMQTVFAALTVLLFLTAIAVVAKYCRCPHCGRVIFLGVLAISTCPGCKRSLVTGKKVKKSR